jgi:hypothetical protein
MGGDARNISDETLLGYLIGGLTDQESALVEAELDCSEVLRQRLSDLRAMLEPLAAIEESYEPRADLIDDTMAEIEAQIASSSTHSDVSAGNGSTSGVSSAFPQSTPASRFGGITNDWSEAPVGTRVAWLDSLVTVAAGIIFLSFLLPSVWLWRESARRINCQDNIRHVGFALFNFGSITASRSIPAIDRVGPLTFAGVYSIRLKDFGLLESARRLHCPSNGILDLPPSIPTSVDFATASPEQQRFWRYLVGGNYAYNLGYLVDGQYVTPKVDQSVRFAVIGDTWPSNYGVIDRADTAMTLHGERGVNVMYNDGSIQWLRVPDEMGNSSLDNPYLNAHFEQSAGIGLSDSCLGPSHCLPTFGIRAKR